MTRAEFRCDISTPEALERLRAAPLPLGLVVRAEERRWYRDVYLDSTDQALAVRGIACRIRYGADDRRTLALSFAPPHTPLAPADVYQADAAAVEIADILAADTPPARRLRGIIEPARLAPWLELEIERVERTGSRRWLRPGRFAFGYDRVTVRNGRLTREFQELKVRRLTRGGPRLEALARALERDYGVRLVLQTKLARARVLLRQMGQESVIRDLDSGRAVAVLALDAGRVALLNDDGGRRLPVADGSGEQAVRHLLGTWLGSHVGETTLLGVAPPSLDRGSLEVWLVRRLRRGVAPPGVGGVEWVAVDELARAVRAGTLRHPATLAAFGIAARSPVVSEWSDGEAAAPAEPTAEPGDQPTDLLDGPASLLEFNARVLALAEDARTPLLERLRYLAILSANLDELHMSHAQTLPPPRVRELLDRQRRAVEECLAALAEQGHRLLRWAQVDESERRRLQARFRQEFFPLLTPRAITMSPGHPFPVIPALTLALAVVLQDQETGPAHFTYVRLPATLPRFVELSDGRDLVPLEEIVAANLGFLFPGRHVEAAALFRVTRSGDLEVEDAEAGDLLQAIEEELGQRSLNPVVRLELQCGASPMLRDMLVQELSFEPGSGRVGLGELVTHEVDGLMAAGDLRQLAGLPVAGGLFPPAAAAAPLRADRPLWEQLREREVLVHHPYDDFGRTVLRLLEDAADDPAVLAVRMTLYRAGDRSPVVDALTRAAESGKEVAVFVELKASFDEARNIAWVRQLERAGAQVVYGLVGLKNHAKVALVVRREADGIRRYVHVGTGNYNAGTARLYTDLGLLSADPALGEDLNDLFNQLTGSASAPRAPLRRLVVAPEHLLPGLRRRIEREAEHARAGLPARIRAKLNGLDDGEVIRALYAASGAGVDVELVVRGLCTLRPGVPGLSERIRVRSLVGRFLEHARIYHFANGGDDEYLIGSADWRSRNLRRRIEAAVDVADPLARRRLDLILTQELADPSAWDLCPDGRYRQERNLPVGDASTAQARALAAARDATEQEAAWSI